MEHKPSSLLCNAKVAGDFVGTDSVLAVGDDPHCGKPLVEIDGGVFKDGSDLSGELFTRMLVLALPCPTRGNEANVSTVASGARNAIGPANHHAVVKVRKESDGFYQGVGVAHRVHRENVP